MTAVPDWEPAYGVRGDLDFVRISASALGVDPAWACREQLARKTRPAAYLDIPYSQAVRPPWESFAIGLVREVMLRWLGAVDLGVPRAESAAAALAALTADGRWEQPSLQAVKAAVNGYADLLRRLRTEGGWDDARFAGWVVASDPAQREGVVEWFAWGVHVVRDSQRVRETHLLRWRGAGERRAAAARVALAARNLADGFVPKPLAKWGQQYTPMPTQPGAPERVVVRELGLLDASSAVLFEGTPEEARRAFAAEVPSALGRLTAGSGNPGSRCADCNVLPLCPHPVRAPGILGVAGRSEWLRPLTPGDLSASAVCPLQLHLRRDLGLPRAESEPSVAVRRGTLVHAWLAAAHERGVACSPADLPDAGPGPVAAALAWAPDDYALARPLLVHHLDCCPYSDELVELRSEVPVSVVDTDSNVVLSTRLDLAARNGEGEVIVRETKTINPSRLPDEEGDLIRLFPQVAFPIVALAAGLDPLAGRLEPVPVAGRVELELLHGEYGVVVEFDVADPDIVLAARVALAQDVDLVVHDTSHQPRPGGHCRWCEVRDWCPAKSEIEVELAGELEPYEAEAPLGDRLDTLALIARTVIGEAGPDEDIPF